jgi:DNA polymerase (family 10)
VENVQIAAVFDEIADLLELQQSNEFRVRSYRNAARTVRDFSGRLEQAVADGMDLTELPGIGQGTAEKIVEIVRTGTCARLEEQRGNVPPELTQLLRVPQLGPRTAMQLLRELNVRSLDDLRQACRDHKVRALAGMGEKSEEKLLRGIATAQSTAGRFLLSQAVAHAESLGEYLDGLDAVACWELAGSFRRRKETIGDLDVLVQAADRDAATEQILAYGPIAEVIGRGKEKISVRLDSDLQVDFRYFEPRVFGAALLYFTGSKDHNIALRKRTVERGWKLNEYGLFKDDRLLAGKTEQSIYHRLNLDYVPPELRENRGEIAAAEQGRLPRLIEPADIRGDLQMHTDRTDGADTLEQMVQAARARGYEYVAITDHSKRVSMAHGLDEEAVLSQAEQIRRLDRGLEDIWVMAGVEVDILKDGSLDLDPDVLAQLDWVLASVHYDRNMDEQQMTDRLVAALSTGVVHCLGHPTGRIIGEREPVGFDTEAVFRCCAENDVYVEINAQPDRLDLADFHCKRAREAGVRFAISTDAHKAGGLDAMRYGVYVARRGWLEAGDVLNTLGAAQLRKRLGAR